MTIDEEAYRDLARELARLEQTVLHLQAEQRLLYRIMDSLQRHHQGVYHSIQTQMRENQPSNEKKVSLRIEKS